MNAYRGAGAELEGPRPANSSPAVPPSLAAGEPLCLVQSEAMTSVGVSCVGCGCQVLWCSSSDATRDAFARDFVLAHAACEGEVAFEGGAGDGKRRALVASGLVGLGGVAGAADREEVMMDERLDELEGMRRVAERVAAEAGAARVSAIDAAVMDPEVRRLLGVMYRELNAFGPLTMADTMTIVVNVGLNVIAEMAASLPEATRASLWRSYLLTTEAAVRYFSGTDES